MITGIDFVSLPAADLARAKAFYRDTLGLAPGNEIEGAWAEFDLGEGPALALVNPKAYDLPADPVASPGTVAIAFSDFEGMVAKMESQGRIARPAFESPVCHGAFATDSEGNGFALHRRKGEPGRDREIDFVGLPVADMTRARAFYEGTLGLVPDVVSDENVWTEYVLADGSALALGAVSHMGLEFKPVVSGSVGLRTPDLEAVFDQLKGLGLAEADAPFETPVCFMGFVRDSEGNALVLHRHK